MMWEIGNAAAALVRPAVPAFRKMRYSAAMITALVSVADPDAADAVDRLADTLGALVGGVAAGLVADAVIVASEAVEAVEAVAEATGAALVVLPRGANPWASAARLARRDWVLCLEAGDVPAEGWIRTLDRFVGTARAETGLGRLRRPHGDLATRIALALEAVIGVGRVRAGDLLRRETLSPAGTVAPRLRPRRLLARIDRA